MQAWVYLHESLPQKEDKILQHLALLQQIKKLTEQNFQKHGVLKDRDLMISILQHNRFEEIGFLYE